MPEEVRVKVAVGLRGFANGKKESLRLPTSISLSCHSSPFPPPHHPPVRVPVYMSACFASRHPSLFFCRLCLSRDYALGIHHLLLAASVGAGRQIWQRKSNKTDISYADS